MSPAVQELAGPNSQLARSTFSGEGPGKFTDASDVTKTKL